MECNFAIFADNFVGASSGIGRYCAIEFAKNGARVAITGRNAGALQETTKLIVENAKSKAEDVNTLVYTISIRLSKLEFG